MPRWEDKIKVVVDQKLYMNNESGYALLQCTGIDDKQMIMVEYQKHGNDISEGYAYEMTGLWDENIPHKFLAKKSVEIKDDDSALKSNLRYVLEHLRLMGLNDESKIDRFVEDYKPKEKPKTDGINVDYHDDDYPLLPDNDWDEVSNALGHMNRLRELNIPAYVCYAAWRTGHRALINDIIDDPYLIQRTLHCMTFKEIDETAGAHLNIPRNDIKRCIGIIYDLLINNRNTYVPLSKLLHDGMLVTMAPDEQPLRDAVKEMAANGIISEYIDPIAFVQKDYQQEKDPRYMLTQMHIDEEFIAARLAVLMQYDKQPALSVDMDKIAQRLDGIELDEDQKNAVKMAAENQILMITGGAGVGKTQTVSAIVAMLQQNGKRVAMAAPTGRAANRMKEKTGGDASTIHYLLQASTDGTCGRNENNPISTDALIIDESSMISMKMMCWLLRAIQHKTRLIFVGDPNQLQPVETGAPFHDLVMSGLIPVTKLTINHRQGEGSKILELAEAVLNGTKVNLGDYANECQIYELTKTDDINEQIKASMTEDAMVIAPLKQGQLGTIALNRLLQNHLNANGEFLTCSRDKTIFRAGDRVMELENHAMELLYNGDIGRADSLTKNNELSVVFDRGTHSYPWNKLGTDDGELNLAYAMTIHKSQGSEYPVVIFPFGQYRGHMERAMLYTAITRAQKKLILIGSQEVINEALSEVNKSDSLLKQRLTVWIDTQKKLNDPDNNAYAENADVRESMHNLKTLYQFIDTALKELPQVL